MNKKIYLNNNRFTIGMTFKDSSVPEENNMALHVCENEAHVIENRKKLLNTLDFPLDNLIVANQTHSSNFYKVSVKDKGQGSSSVDNAIGDTDAMYTYEPNILLGTFSADCVPLMFFNETVGLVGVIHSGWQGTVKLIASRLFEHLINVEKCNPKDFQVYIGAALSQEKFEVDEDVYSKFTELGYADEFMYFKKETGKYHIDNQRVVAKQLQLVGIPTTQIIVDRTCTFKSPEGFSYRQDKKAGRHMGFIMRKEGISNESSYF